METKGKAVDSVIQYQLHRDGNNDGCKCETGIKNLVIEEIVTVESNAKATASEKRCYTNLTRQDLLSNIIVANKVYIFDYDSVQDEYNLFDTMDCPPNVLQFKLVDGEIEIDAILPVGDREGNPIFFNTLCEFDSNGTLYFSSQL